MVLMKLLEKMSTTKIEYRGIIDQRILNYSRKKNMVAYTQANIMITKMLKPLLETRFGGDAWSEIRNSHKQTGLASYE